MTDPLILQRLATISKSSSPQQPFPIPQEEVARRAYMKWIARNQGSDQNILDWLEAETELALAAAYAGELTEAQERISRLLAEEHCVERRLVAEHAVSGVLAEASELSDAASKLIHVICECFDWDAGAVWVLDRDANLLRCLEIWHRPEVEIPAFKKESLQRTYS